MSLHSHVGGTRDYIHIPASVPLMLVSLSYMYYMDIEGLLYTLMIPEGISYHIKFTKQLTLSPYLNPLGFDYYYNSHNADFNTYYMSSALGFKAHFEPLPKIYVIPLAESNVLW